jgi:hypothetical protein
MTIIDLATYVVRDEDGSVDVDATVTKFEEALVTYVTENEAGDRLVADAVNAVFDAHKGSRINMPALTALALQHLNVQPENHKALTTRVQQYIRANVGELGTGKALNSTKGKGGGVCRVSDLPKAVGCTAKK